jgi:hypothetical protein
MKRLIPVLAIALVLVFCSWDDASALRYPEGINFETVQWDHPWGGEQQDQPDNPPYMDATPTSSNEDLGVLDIFKIWYRNLSPSLFYRFNSNDGNDNSITTEFNPEPDPQTETNQESSQRGF